MIMRCSSTNPTEESRLFFSLLAVPQTEQDGNYGESECVKDDSLCIRWKSDMLLPKITLLSPWTTDLSVELFLSCFNSLLLKQRVKLLWKMEKNQHVSKPLELWLAYRKAVIKFRLRSCSYPSTIEQLPRTRRLTLQRLPNDMGVMQILYAPPEAVLLMKLQALDMKNLLQRKRVTQGSTGKEPSPPLLS